MVSLEVRFSERWCQDARKRGCGSSDSAADGRLSPSERLPLPSRTAAGTGFRSQITPKNDISFSM